MTNGSFKFFLYKAKKQIGFKTRKVGFIRSPSCLLVSQRVWLVRLPTYQSLPSSSYEDANSLVTIGDGKFYSLGLDLEHMATMAPYELITFTSDLQKLLARLLTFPLVTVAAINGT